MSKYVVVEFRHNVAAMVKTPHERHAHTNWEIIAEYDTAGEAIACAKAIAIFKDRSFINCIPTK